MHNKKPLISIITVVFNGEKYLEKTIESIIDQSYDHIEYIIIDGGSTDCTLDIIKKYEDKIDYWISEKDRGVYDGMNKGIAQVNGEWINFMNAGDSFINKNVLSTIVDEIKKDDEVIYGDRIVQYDNNNTKYNQPNGLASFYKGMPFCHQATFIASDLMRSKKYDLQYKICADFNFFYNAYNEGKKFKYVEIPIVLYDYNGISSDSISSYTEQRNIVLSYDKRYKFYYTYLFYRNFLKKYIKKILPLYITRKIQMMKKGKK